MGVISCQTLLEAINDSLRDKVFSGVDDKYFNFVKDLSEVVLDSVYYIGIAKYEEAMYKDAIRSFRLVFYLTESPDMKYLSGMRICLCYMCMDEAYLADRVYSDLVNNEHKIISKKARIEFNFLVAEFYLTRKMELFAASSVVKYAYSMAVEENYQCGGFAYIVQTIKEKASLAEDNSIFTDMYNILCDMERRKWLNEEMISYLNTSGVRDI